MAARRTGLGRGLDALIRDRSETEIRIKTEEAISEKDVKETSGDNGMTEEPAAKSVKAEKSPKATPKADAKSGKSKASAKGKTASKGKNPAKRTSKADIAPAAEEAPVTGEPAAPAAAEKPVAKAAEAAAEEKEEKAGERLVRISLVEPNRSQPRKTFSDDSIRELADSIRQHGVIQPLLVQEREDHYEIIAGERRWRAAKEAGLKMIPVIVRDYSTQEAVEVSLIENIQREDLNPIEEAQAYRNLMTDFALKQEDVARKVSKSRAAVANAMRLLRLDARVQAMVVDGRLTEGHARALLVIEDGDKQFELAEKIAAEHLTVRQVETLIRQLTKPARPASDKGRDPQREAIFASLSEKLKGALGTKVTINQMTKRKGRIEIEYYSDAELERIFDLLMALRSE